MLFKDFLETIGLYKSVLVEDFLQGDAFKHWPNYPEINVECDYCKGKRIFKQNNSASPITYDDEFEIKSVIYVCKNCSTTTKSFTIRYKVEDGFCYSVCKIGEYPPFGEKIPSKIISMFGPERDYFLKGKRSEDQNLGIGAFTYYRRIVENEKNRLIDEIIKVCKRLGDQDELIVELEAAKKEKQFSTSIDSINHELPSSLFIEGKNPLKLLHQAISKGVHNLNDEECLMYAQSVRVILFALTERINAILKDSTEIHDAVTVLSKLNSQ